MEDQQQSHTPADDLASGDAETQARREVLRRIGVFGAATAPMLLGVLKAEKAVAQTGIPG